MEYVDIWHDLGEKSRYANRVMKKDKFDVVHIHLKKDEEIGSHHAEEETLIIVRNGRIQFNVEGRVVELTKEGILRMDPYEEHDMKALEKTEDRKSTRLNSSHVAISYAVFCLKKKKKIKKK